jgi:hypothetical protein
MNVRLECRCRWSADPTTGAPELVLDQSRYFPDTAKPSVSIDRCIAETVEMLWAHGIRTNHACCGHNGRFGTASVGIVEAHSVPRAAELLRTKDGRQWRIITDI